MIIKDYVLQFKIYDYVSAEEKKSNDFLEVFADGIAIIKKYSMQFMDKIKGANGTKIQVVKTYYMIKNLELLLLPINLKNDNTKIQCDKYKPILVPYKEQHEISHQDVKPQLKIQFDIVKNAVKEYKTAFENKRESALQSYLDDEYATRKHDLKLLTEYVGKITPHNKIFWCPYYENSLNYHYLFHRYNIHKLYDKLHRTQLPPIVLLYLDKIYTEEHAHFRANLITEMFRAWLNYIIVSSGK